MITLLAAADLHLGRQTLIPGIEEHTPEFSAVYTWKRIVDTAISQQVDALLCTGDMIDRENSYLETFGPLEAGLIRLAEHGIKTVLVAGNHDWETLPDFISRLPSTAAEYVTLLGKGGQWERLHLACGDETLELLGWSFPSTHHKKNPVALGELQQESSIPVIGLLHGDLDVADSLYAPLSGHDLTDVADLWLLGHIHKPGCMRSSWPQIWYPGSPHSLSPKETGAHGLLKLEVNSKHDIRVTHKELSPIRFEVLEIACTSDQPIDERTLNDLIHEHIRSFATAHQEELESVRHIGITLRLTGSARFVTDPEKLFTDQPPSIPYGDSTYYLLKAENETRVPVSDLEELSKGKGPDAQLARLITALEQGKTDDPFVQRMVERARTSREQVANHGTYIPIYETHRLPSDSELLELVKKQAYRILDTLLQQRGGQI
ncbi:MAG: metallophosphoesterase family protein [Spirochaetota bacterium]